MHARYAVTAKAGLENVSISGNYRSDQWMWPAIFKTTFLGEFYGKFH